MSLKTSGTAREQEGSGSKVKRTFSELWSTSEMRLGLQAWKVSSQCKF